MEPTDECSNDDDFDQENFDDVINTRPFPWIKVVIRILNKVNLTCDHQIKCTSNCYDKQTASCKHLIQALLNMYRLSSSTLTNVDSSFSRSSSSTHRSATHLKRNDTTSSKTHLDPKKRRVSSHGHSYRVGLNGIFFLHSCRRVCSAKVPLQTWTTSPRRRRHQKDLRTAWCSKQPILILNGKSIRISRRWLPIWKNRFVVRIVVDRSRRRTFLSLPSLSGWHVNTNTSNDSVQIIGTPGR